MWEKSILYSLMWVREVQAALTEGSSFDVLQNNIMDHE